jgi:hypothetical protein
MSPGKKGKEAVQKKSNGDIASGLLNQARLQPLALC